MAQLDETISEGQPYHIEDHEQLHKKANYVFDVMDYGAVGDGSTDNLTAIQAAIDAASAAGGGTVLIPTGTFIITSTSADLLMVPSNITIQGTHRDTSIVKLKANHASTFAYMLWVGKASAADDVIIRDLTIDGNASNQAVGEHRTGIFVGYSSPATNILIENVVSQNHTGDALQLWDCEDVTIRDCLFKSCDRDGISLTGNAGQRILVDGCRFDDIAVQEIDSEPTTGGYYDYVTITNCFFMNAQIETGYSAVIGGTSRANKNWIVTNNYIERPIRVRYTDGAIIANNTIIAMPGGPGACIYGLGVSDGVQVVGNRLIDNTTTPGTNYAAVIFQATGAPVDEVPTNVLVADNYIELNAAASMNAVLCWGVLGGVFTGNRIVQTYASAYFAIRAVGSPQDHILIANNVCDGAGYTGVQLYGHTTHTSDGIHIVNNQFDDLTDDGIQIIGGATYLYSDLFISGNVTDSTLAVDSTVHTYRTGEERWAGSGTPESVITARIGGIYVDKAGGAGTTLYVKESGTGNTGWIAMATDTP